MILKAATNKVGSECECELGYTKEEREALSEQDQSDVINEMMANVVDVWVEEDR